MKQIISSLILLIVLAGANIYCQSFSCGDTLIDSRDGQKYATVLIGSDCWFKQNLNYGTYVQSDSLGIIHSQQTNNGVPEKYAQNNDTNNLAIYGGLYEQSELMNYSTSSLQGLCPNGWHVSTDQEWLNLISNAGGTIMDSAGFGGNALKAIGEGSGMGTGTDLVGISLRHGGDRDGFGIFYGLGLRAIYWTSTLVDPSQAYHYTLWATNDTIQRLSLGTTTTGFSCRCVKDNTTGINSSPINYLKVYPNPSSSYLKIHSNVNGNTTITNSTGVVVKFISVTKLQTTTIDLQGLAKGIYSVVFQANDASFETKKIIIQ